MEEDLAFAILPAAGTFCWCESVSQQFIAMMQGTFYCQTSNDDAASCGFGSQFANSIGAKLPLMCFYTYPFTAALPCPKYQIICHLACSQFHGLSL